VNRFKYFCAALMHCEPAVWTREPTSSHGDDASINQRVYSTVSTGSSHSRVANNMNKYMHASRSQSDLDADCEDNEAIGDNYDTSSIVSASELLSVRGGSHILHMLSPIRRSNMKTVATVRRAQAIDGMDASHNR
jgi:hypothetical protein